MVEKEIESLQKSDQPLQKILTINGSSDTIILQPSAWQNDTNYWEKEFAALYSFEAKPSWSRQFQMLPGIRLEGDTNKNWKTLIYHATDSGLPVREVSLEKNGDEIESVSLKLVDEKDLYHTQRNVVLIPGRFYKVSSKRTALGREPEIVDYSIQLKAK